MIDLKFELKKRKNAYGLVIIRNRDDNINIKCLVDTGATMPVWCAGEQLLLSYYPKAVKQNCMTILNGFGKGYEKASVYKIPDFVLSDGKNKIHYINLLVAVMDRDYSFEMILSYTMFSRMNLSVNTFTNRNGLHRITPNLRINSINSTYHVGARRYATTDVQEQQLLLNKFGTYNILDDIYLFTQN